MNKINHRGIEIVRRANRWRFYWAPIRGYVARESLELAIGELDHLLDIRSRERYAAEADGYSIGGLVAEWWSRKKPELRESTQLRYEGVVRLHIQPQIGHLAANLVRPLDIEDFYSRLTHKTALVCRDVLRPAFKWGLANHLVVRNDGVNPLDLASLVRSRCLDGDAENDVNRTMQVDERLIPTVDEIEKMLAEAEERADWKWWLYLRLAPTLGARPGEMCALQRADIKEETYTVSITKAANPATLKITQPKRPASIRTLYVGRDLFDDVLPLLDGLPADGWLFPATGLYRGERKLPTWNTHGVGRQLARSSKLAGVPRYTPHSLRHFTATHLLDQGWPAMQVAKWLGHRNDTMVRLLYAAHVVEDTRILLGEAAGRLLRRQAPDLQ